MPTLLDASRDTNLVGVWSSLLHVCQKALFHCSFDHSLSDCESVVYSLVTIRALRQRLPDIGVYREFALGGA